jgi:hypothetical protein
VDENGEFKEDRAKQYILNRVPVLYDSTSNRPAQLAIDEAVDLCSASSKFIVSYPSILYIDNVYLLSTKMHEFERFRMHFIGKFLLESVQNMQVRFQDLKGTFSKNMV